VTRGTKPTAVGRDEELSSIVRFLDARDELPAALLLEGEAGIGKTTLWQVGTAAARERSFQVLACQTAPSDTPLSFAALRDLLEGVFDVVAARLSTPKRRALAVALLHEDPGGTAPPPGAVAAAFVDAVRLLALAGPVLLAVDDVQWLDQPTTEVLEFAVRRLQNEPVGLLLTRRATRADRLPLRLERAHAVRVDRLMVGGLSLGAIHVLLRDRLGMLLLRPTLRRLFDASGGNPLFALEIAGALKRREWRPASGEPPPLPATLQELVGDRLADLPVPAQTVLRVAAATPMATVTLVREAVGRDVAAAGLEAGLAASVIEVDGERVRLAHPLLASVVYAATPPSTRREIHGRLADVAPDLEQRARHLALACPGPDATVAGILEEAAARVRARGAVRAAAELSQYSVQLTPASHSDDALRRTIEAAGYHFDAGDAVAARTMLDEAVRSAPKGKRRAAALTQLARAHTFGANLRIGSDFYRQALAEAEDDTAVRAEAEHGLAVVQMRMLVDLPSAAEHAREAASLVERRGDPRAQCEFLTTQGHIETLLGEPCAAATMARGRELARSIGDHEGLHSADFLRSLRGWRFTAAVLALLTDDYKSARDRFKLIHALALELGDEASLPLLLRYLSYADFLAGDWALAGRWADEGYEAALQTGQTSQLAVLAATQGLIKTHLGLSEAARAAAEDGLRLAAETGAMFGRLIALSALGFLELSLSKPRAAMVHLGPLIDEMEAAGIREPGATTYYADAIEALVALGRLNEAATLLERFAARARRLDRFSAVAAAERCRGLLCAARGDFDGARTSLAEALAAHERATIPFDRGRTLLALGSVERRAKRKRAARERLGQALAVFEQLGARLWAEKTRAELARIGGRTSSRDELTAVERRVAELVAEGRTNRAVASQVFVTDKTVEFHLRNIFRKLGIRSRAELARQVGEKAAAIHGGSSTKD
jgi:DNA-binding CsgD family transcriptional regulator